MGANNKAKIADSLGLETAKVSRSYMMTVWFDKNGQTFEEKKEIMQQLFDGGYIRYAALSKEICPDTGRLHGHLFTRFVDGWSGVKAFQAYNIQSGGGWFEESRKDFASFEYVSCSGHFAEGQKNGKPKPLDFFEIGERPKSQERSKKKDFAACLAMIEDGAELVEVCRAFPEIALKGFTNLQKFYLLIRENKSKEKLAKQFDENSKKEGEKEYFLSPHFEPKNIVEKEDVLKLFCNN